MVTSVTIRVSEGHQATVTQIVQGAPSPDKPVVVLSGELNAQTFKCRGTGPEVMDTFLIQEEPIPESEPKEAT